MADSWSKGENTECQCCHENFTYTEYNVLEQNIMRLILFQLI
jgi:hypothetical protein